MQHAEHFHGFFCACRPETMKKISPGKTRWYFNFLLLAGVICMQLTLTDTLSHLCTTLSDIQQCFPLQPTFLQDSSHRRHMMLMPCAVFAFFILFSSYFLLGGVIIYDCCWECLEKGSSFRRAIGLGHCFNASGQLRRL